MNGSGTSKNQILMSYTKHDENGPLNIASDYEEEIMSED